MPSSAAGTTEHVRRLVEGQSLAVLATQGESGPHASLVGYVSTADLRHVLFATSRMTRKYTNLRRQARVALLIDNRSSTQSDFHKATGVTVRGKAREVCPEERQEMLELYLEAHPYLRDFVTSPSCALMVVHVEKYSLVTRFQNVMELVLDP